MLDIKLIRDEPELVKAKLKRRGVDTSRVDDIRELDQTRRLTQTELDKQRATLKDLSKQISTAKDREPLKAQAKAISDDVARLDADMTTQADRLRALLLGIPNLPHDTVPDGASEDDNVELRTNGVIRAFDFEPRDHLDLGESLGIIDMARAANVSGARFAFMLGAGAMLWSALSRFALEHVAKHGHIPVIPPVLVRREAMEGTGFFPAGEDQIYQLEKDELYLVGTSEVPLAAMHMDEILASDSLPLRYAGQSACFRREAGAAGKDTRGIFRNHQFEKVEMFAFVRPEDSWDEHERLIAIEEAIMQALGLPYRAMVLCTADLGAPSAKTVDLEVWFPGQKRYRETTSCSNTTDYQARRLNIRIKTDKATTFVHTLNGTVATSSRHIAAILENYQQEDGSVAVPDVLRPYCGFDVIRPA